MDKDCVPQRRSGCNCPGHTMPGVFHMVACCNEPHIEDAVKVDVAPEIAWAEVERLNEEFLLREDDMSATLEDLCQLMHDTYETAAVKHGWHTNARTRVSWAQVPVENKATMRDAVKVVVEAVREDEQIKNDPGVMQHDLRQIMQTLGISTQARPSSPHEVVQNEILPKLRRMMQYSPEMVRFDLSQIMEMMAIDAPTSYSAHEVVHNKILPELSSRMGRLYTQERLNLKMKKTLAKVRAAVSKHHVEVNEILDEE